MNLKQIQKVAQQTRGKKRPRTSIAVRERNIRMGIRPSAYALQRASEVCKGKPIPEERKERIRLALMGEKNHFYGKKHSPESREKISKAQKGKPITGQQLENLRKSRQSPEYREKLRKANLGKKLSPEHKKAISEGLKRAVAEGRPPGGGKNRKKREVKNNGKE